MKYLSIATFINRDNDNQFLNLTRGRRPFLTSPFFSWNFRVPWLYAPSFELPTDSVNTSSPKSLDAHLFLHHRPYRNRRYLSAPISFSRPSQGVLLAPRRANNPSWTPPPRMVPASSGTSAARSRGCFDPAPGTDATTVTRFPDRTIDTGPAKFGFIMR